MESSNFHGISEPMYPNLVSEKLSVYLFLEANIGRKGDYFALFFGFILDSLSSSHLRRNLCFWTESEKILYLVAQDIQLGLHRSDYMLDMATGSLLQVELNTISSSFAGLGALTSKLHQ